MNPMVKELRQALTSVDDEAGLEAVRVEFLGRKGKLAEAMKALAGLPLKDRKGEGAELNAAKQEMESLFDSQKNSFEHKKSSGLANTEWIDVTLPGVAPAEGHLHLTTQAIMEIEDIFARVGFTRVTAPDVDWDWYAFESLNILKTIRLAITGRRFCGALRSFSEGGSIGQDRFDPAHSNSQVRELEKGSYRFA